MSDDSTTRIPIDPELFCDGHGYLLTSSSFGGSGMSASTISEILFNEKTEKAREMIRDGVCMPVVFEGDCALDESTVFLLGDLSEEEERNWIARLSSILKIPCGKLVVCCGWADEDLAPAAEGKPPEEDYVMYQVIELPPGDYQVEIYAFLSSLTVQVSLDEEDEDGFLRENEELLAWYERNRPGVDGVDYIVRLTPLEGEPEITQLEKPWFDSFEFRPSG